MTGFASTPGGVVEHESALERDFVTLTRFADAGVQLTSQPVTIRFVQDDQRRRYTPDFRVDWSDGRVEIVEIKYRSDLRSGWFRMRPGFVAARDWAKARGAVFRIATERSIRGAELELARRLLPLRDAPLDRDVAVAALGLTDTIEHLTFGALVAALPFPRDTATGTIWRLLARGDLGIDGALPVTMATRIARA